ncbi:bacteriophage CI repressor [Pantoea sp. AS-PWVM4]|uniref:phage repressor protein CI n=1 Tax=Pantoea sp. AS-PWVM4 TaxID=1332069 RepID=UPI0003AC77B6|nr:phage repressor protein CI [Pantoea sp. AS-PWVM4]ERK13251.1 bacteriophage CI repressor [Pantoea sp. AS-PWVM4]
MPGSYGDVREILGRILDSYGVSTRQAYADLAGMPIGTVNNWLKRGNLPGDYIVQCALETGADLNWLVSGEFTNANSPKETHFLLKGKALLASMLESGGKPVIRRLMQAYGFNLQKELGDYLDIPSPTMSAWVRRDHFPGEVVIACALDTGASLYWLATGKGAMHSEENTSHSLPDEIRCIPKYSIHTGIMSEHGAWYCDSSLLDDSINNPALIVKGSNQWCVDLDAKTIGNGRWVIDLDGIIDVYDVSRLPGNRLNVKNESSRFECNADDIECVGMVLITLSKNS